MPYVSYKCYEKWELITTSSEWELLFLIQGEIDIKVYSTDPGASPYVAPSIYEEDLFKKLYRHDLAK